MRSNILFDLKQYHGELLRFRKVIISCFMLILFLMSFTLQAEISAVVIETNFKIGAWQPLPEDKIKSASVDSALSEISKSKRFAFFTSSQEGIKTGTLKISIKLIEAAETATVSVYLRQADGISVFSTHSESLKNQSYNGIYKRFQLAGEQAGKKLIKILQSQPVKTSRQGVPEQDKKRILYLENQIININKNIVNQSDKNTLRSEVKLEFILNELQSIKSSYIDLAKKEDIQKQGLKIDKVLNEVGQLNKKIDNKPTTQINVNQSYVLENALIGQSAISNKAPAGRDDSIARKLYNDAQELKREEKYKKAENNLQRAVTMSISPEFRSLIYDELIYSLPMYEAQAIAIKLGRNFQAYNKSGEDKIMQNKITYLYKTALKNNQQNFQRTRQIQNLLDQHYNTGQAMSAVVSVQNKVNGTRIHHRLLEIFMMRGEYPDKKSFEKVVKNTGLRFKVLSYQVANGRYTAALQSDSGEVIKLAADEGGHVKVE